jgi:predicted nucleic acid-binding protein
MSQAFADPPRLIGDLILAELLQVFARDTDYRTARKLLLELPAHRSGQPRKCLLAADYYRRLRKRAVTVRKTIDVLISAYRVRHSHELLHADRDFDPDPPPGRG